MKVGGNTFSLLSCSIRGHDRVFGDQMTNQLIFILTVMWCSQGSGGGLNQQMYGDTRIQ